MFSKAYLLGELTCLVRGSKEKMGRGLIITKML